MSRGSSIIDPGNSSKIMYQNLYRALKLPAKDLIQVNSSVFGFSSEAVWPVTCARLPVRVAPIQMTMEFLIMDINAPYNAIMGRNWLGEMRVVTSSFHQKLKFPSQKNVAKVRNRDQAHLWFYMAVQGSHQESDKSYGKKSEAVDQNTLALVGPPKTNINQSSGAPSMSRLGGCPKTGFRRT